MPNDSRLSHAEIVKAARQARAEAMQNWLMVLSAALLNFLGTSVLHDPLSRRQR